MRLSHRPPVWVWLVLALTIGLGLAGGYLGAAGPDSPAPASNHSGNDMPGMDMGPSALTGHNGHTMSDGQSMPGMSMSPSLPASPAGHTMPGASASSMAGMDMNGGSMPGMDMGATADSTGHGAHTAATAPATTHPRTAVLGAFVLLNGGVLAAAATLRHRARARRRPATSR